MWPLISSARIAAACSRASSGVSANFTPPAFMRPPVSTWDLITTGPPTSRAISAASSAVVAKPPGATGTPSRSRTWRDSYSKSLMRSALRRPPSAGSCPDHPVCLSQFRVLCRQHLGQPHHNLALLPRRVVLHLAVDHVHAAAVGDRLDDLARECHLFRIGREDLLGDADLHGVQRPGAHAAEQERGAELGLAALDVLDVAVGAVERKRPDGGAGIHHARDRVMPGILLVARSR